MKEGGSLWDCEDRGRSMGSEDMNLVSSQRIETALNSQRVYQPDHLQYRCAPSVVNQRRGDSGRKARPAGVSGFVEPGGKLYANDRERYLAPQRDFRSGIYSADDGRQDSIVVEPDSRRGTVNMNMSMGMNSGGLQMRGMLGRNPGGRTGQPDWSERVGVMGGDGSAGSQSEDGSEDEDDDEDDGDGEMEGEVERMQDSMAANDNSGNNNNGSNNNGSSVHGSLEGFQKSNLDREGGIPKTALQNHHPSLNMFLSPPFLNSFPSPSGAPALLDATSAAQNGGGGAGGVAASSGFYRDGLVKEPPALPRENNNSSVTANTGSLHEHHQARIPHGLHHEGTLPVASVPDADNYYTQLLQSTGSLAHKDAGVDEGGAFGERKGTTASTESSESSSLRIILSDPLTGTLMDDATILTCGHSFGSGGLQHVLEARACITCGQPVANDSIAPNHALRAVVQAFRREEEFQSMSSKSAKRRRDKFEQVLEKTGYSDPMSMDCSRGKGVQFPFVVGDRVVIKGNKRTPERFVGREAVITTQCLNGWYVVKTLDNAESVKLQYRQLLQHARGPVFYSCIGILVYKKPIFFPIPIPYVNCLRFIVLQVIFIMSIRIIACLVILVFFKVTLGTMASSQAVSPPLPVLPIPNARQLKWQQREMTMFFHFGMNTFTDREWGDGQEDPQLFDPKALNATQWAAVAKEAGFSLVILTAKHHDGFCLWQTAYTNHSVRDSPWEDGKGDIVKDLAKAAQAVGLDFGVYLSPWDRHEPTYGLELQYNEFYLGQLQELLTKYGQISEVWFDGAKGKNATKMNYMFTTWFEMVHELQISANIFSDAGPDVRWVGDEAGAAGLTSWSTINGSALKIGDADIEGYLNTGDPYGTDWIPAECDVSIRAGWFWHKSKKPRPLSKLLNIYYHSVGRNCLLLLNVPPNTSGLISAEDATRLLQLKKAIKTIFSKDLAAFATVTASSVRGGYNSGPFAPVNVLNDDVWSYWAPAEQNGGAYWVELMAKETMEFNVVRIQEAIGLGQRVMKYSVFARMAEFETEVLVAHGSTIGYKRLHRLDAHVKATSVKLLVEECRGGIPLISSFGLHLDPFYHPKNRSL